MTTPATTTNAQRWLYSLANLGLVITVQAFSAYVLFFYTDVKHHGERLMQAKAKWSTR
jgi:hypothetical protein